MRKLNLNNSVNNRLSDFFYRVKSLIFKYPKFNVKIQDCMTMTGFSFSNKGWHHLIKLLEEFDENPNLKMKDSILYSFHNKFQPKYNTFFSNFVP